jgi:hypothetical protein
MPRACSSYLESSKDRYPDARAALAALSDGAIATNASGDAFFDAGDPLALCAGCVRVAHRLGARPSLFVPGVPPRQGRGHEEPPAPGGWGNTGPKKW